MCIIYKDTFGAKSLNGEHMSLRGTAICEASVVCFLSPSDIPQTVTEEEREISSRPCLHPGTKQKRDNKKDKFCYDPGKVPVRSKVLDGENLFAIPG